MQRIGVLIALAGAALFLTAAAAPARHAKLSIPKPPPSAAAAGLRGPQTPAQPRPAVQARAAPLPAQPPNPAAALTPAIAAPVQPTLTPIAAAADAGQCRRACARPYYFCLAGDDAD